MGSCTDLRSQLGMFNVLRLAAEKREKQSERTETLFDFTAFWQAKVSHGSAEAYLATCNGGTNICYA